MNFLKILQGDEEQRRGSDIDFIGGKVLVQVCVNGFVGHVSQEDQVVHTILVGTVGLQKKS